MPDYIYRAMNHIKYFNEDWLECQRWYKWLSVIPLFVANILGPLSILLFGRGEAGWQAHQKDEFIDCLFRLISFALIIAGIACYFSMWIFLALTFIYCYEQPNYKEEIRIYRVKKEFESRVINIYETMNTKSAVIGQVSTNEAVYGRNVYTGWVLTVEGKWIKIHSMRGELLFDSESFFENVPQPEQPSSNKIYPEGSLNDAENGSATKQHDTVKSGDSNNPYGNPQANAPSTDDGPYYYSPSKTTDHRSGEGGGSPYANVNDGSPYAASRN